ncbi:hypothetical protein Tco_0837673 [Tanacetum coccineum]
MFAEMDLFAFICHSDPTKVRVGERNLVDREVKLLKMTEGRTVSLGPPVTAAFGDSSDSIDRLFDEGNDVNQEHSIEKDDDVLEEAIAKDASEVIAEKPQKKQKRKVVGDASGSAYPPKKLRDDYQSLPPNTSGKSLAALRGIIPKGSDLPSGSTEPLIVASVTPMPDVRPVDSVSRLNLQTRPPHVSDVAVQLPVDCCVVCGSKARDVSKDFENIGDSTSACRVNVDTASISKLKKTSTSSDSFYASQSPDTETMHRAYIPRWKVTNDSVLDDPYVYRDLTDRLAPPALFAQLRAMDYGQLYSEFNVGTARQVCLGAEVRMRAEHTLEKKCELEDKCSEHTTLLSEKNTEIAHLKSLLSLKETEAAEAISLRSQLSVVETADAAKSTELRDLKEKNFALEGERNDLSERVTTLESVIISKEAELASLSSQVSKLTVDLSGFRISRDELNSKVASLESERDCLAAQKSSLESAFELLRERIEALIFHRFLNAISGRRWFLSHGLNLVILKCLQSLEYLQALGQAIGCAVNKGIQDGLKAGIDHGKAGRDLSVVEAYDPSAKDKYVDVVNALDAIDFSLLSGPKDNVDFAETSLSSSFKIVNLRVQKFREEAKEKCLSLTDVMTPFVEPLSSKSLTSEASTSTAPITTLSTTIASSAVIPPSSVASDQVLDAEPHSEDPPAVTFKKEELGTFPE